MKHLVTDWGPSPFDNISKRRVHMIDTPSGWQRFAEYKTALGFINLTQVGPAGLPPGDEFHKYSKVAA